MGVTKGGGGVHNSPLEEISSTLSLAISFAHRFMRKKMNGRRNFWHRKKFEKKSGAPMPQTWPKSKKKYYQKRQFVSLLALRHMKI